MCIMNLQEGYIGFNASQKYNIGYRICGSQSSWLQVMEFNSNFQALEKLTLAMRSVLQEADYILLSIL